MLFFTQLFDVKICGGFSVKSFQYIFVDMILTLKPLGSGTTSNSIESRRTICNTNAFCCVVLSLYVGIISLSVKLIGSLVSLETVFKNPENSVLLVLLLVVAMPVNILISMAFKSLFNQIRHKLLQLIWSIKLH